MWGHHKSDVTIQHFFFFFGTAVKWLRLIRWHYFYLIDLLMVQLAAKRINQPVGGRRRPPFECLSICSPEDVWVSPLVCLYPIDKSAIICIANILCIKSSARHSNPDTITIYFRIFNEYLLQFGICTAAKSLSMLVTMQTATKSTYVKRNCWFYNGSRKI